MSFFVSLPLSFYRSPQAYGSYDSRRSSSRSSTGSTASWANPSPRCSRLLYAPLILVEDERSAGTSSVGLWDKKAEDDTSVPVAARTGQPYRAYTTLRVPTQLSPHYSEKRGSADSLVEAVRPERVNTIINIQYYISDLIYFPTVKYKSKKKILNCTPPVILVW